MRYWPIIIVVFLTSCILDFVYEKRIIKNYYLIAVDSMDQLEISLKLKNGDYIGRIPEKVQQYAVMSDTLIFARTTNGYYILNTTNDHDFAEVKDVVIGPVDQATFNRDWLNKHTVNFISPEPR